MPKKPEHRWEPASADTARGRLTAIEEAEIGKTPRPVKPHQVVEAEHAAHLAQADTTSPPDLIPLVLVTMRKGVPTLTEAMLQLLCGESPSTLAQRRCGLLLADLERRSPWQYHLLAARWQDNRSDREIAGELGVAHTTVARMLDHIQLRLSRQYQALYG